MTDMTPVDMLGSPIREGDHLVMAQSSGGSSIKLQVYEILELIPTENWRWDYSFPPGKSKKVVYTSWKAKAQILHTSSYGAPPTRPSFIENFGVSLKIPKGWCDLDA